MFTPKVNSGALFKNDRKTAENQPNAKGDMLLQCPHCQAKYSMWLSAWTRRKDSGEAWQSLALTIKDAQQNAPARSSQAEPQRGAQFDDDVPF